MTSCTRRMRPAQALSRARRQSFAICCMEPCFRREQSAVCSWRSRQQGLEGAFVELMNQNALDMGLVQTHFTNATGLHSEDQYSTPHEIGEILRTALKNKTLLPGIYDTFLHRAADCGPSGRIYILELTF